MVVGTLYGYMPHGSGTLGSIYPRNQFNFISLYCRREVVNLVPHHHPPALGPHLLRSRRLPMGIGHLLNPTHVHYIVDMVQVVDMLRGNPKRHAIDLLVGGRFDHGG